MKACRGAAKSGRIRLNIWGLVLSFMGNVEKDTKFYDSHSLFYTAVATFIDAVLYFIVLSKDNIHIYF
jgi:hypothetical protein